MNSDRGLILPDGFKLPKIGSDASAGSYIILPDGRRYRHAEERTGDENPNHWPVHTVCRAQTSELSGYDVSIYLRSPSPQKAVVIARAAWHLWARMEPKIPKEQEFPDFIAVEGEGIDEDEWRRQFRAARRLDSYRYYGPRDNPAVFSPWILKPV